MRMDAVKYPALFWLFIFGSLLGTLLEGAFCRIRRGRWETHTVALWGPFCIIYGIGAVILYVGAVLTESMPVLVQFAVFAAATTAVEYIGGLLLKRGLHMKAWDYSGCAFNLQGLICIKMTAAWGALGVLFAKYCVPYIKIAARAISGAVAQIVTCISSILMALNLFLTTLCMVRWSRRRRGYPPRNGMERYFDVKYDDEWMQRRFCEWKFLDACTD